MSRSVPDFAGVLEPARARRWSLVAIDLGVYTSTSTGELIGNVVMFVAQWERRIIGEGASAAMQAAARQDKHMGRPSALPTATGDRLPALTRSGLTLAGSAEALNAEGLTTATGDPSHHLNSDGTDRRIAYDKPLRCQGVYRSHVLPALRERGLRELDWYAFRHFYASSRAAQGYDVHTVAKLMGHANISLTYSTYIHLFPNHHDMSRLDALDAAAPAPRVVMIGS